MAWDNIKDEKQILRGVEILKQWMPKGSLMAYVLIGFNTFEEEDLYRVIKLNELGVDPFIMPYNKTDPYQKRFARWVNHKAIFKSVKWENYK